LIKEDSIIAVYSGDRLVGWDREYFKIIDLLKFFSFGGGSTSHTSELAIEFEEVLICDRSDRLCFLFDTDFLFGLDCLM
jgi:hypothetical protein